MSQKKKISNYFDNFMLIVFCRFKNFNCIFFAIKFELNTRRTNVNCTRILLIEKLRKTKMLDCSQRKWFYYKNCIYEKMSTSITYVHISLITISIDFYLTLLIS